MRKIITIFSVLFLGAISAGAQNYDRGYETVPSSPFVTKGTWVAGGTLSYSQHVNDGHNILLISGVDSQGYNISVNPKLLYMIKDNMGVGLRFSYDRSMLDLASADLASVDYTFAVAFADFVQVFEVAEVSEVFAVSPYLILLS